MKYRAWSALSELKLGKTMTNSKLQQLSKGNSQSDCDQVINTELFKGRDVPRSDTPETWLPEFAIKPDITFQCEVCSEYFNIHNLSYHRSYHKALITLGYSNSQLPADVKSLSQKRHNILKKLQADLPKNNCVHPEDVKVIDAAFEIVKNYIEDASEGSSLTDQSVDASLSGVALDCSLDCVYAVGVCSNPNRRWKHSMEDAHVYQDYFGDDRSKCYLAVFDGYHGTVAARRCSRELHGILLHEMAKFDSKVKSTVARNFAESGTARTSYEQLRPDTRESVRVNLHQESTDIVEHVISACCKTYNEMMADRGEGDQKTNHRIKHHTTEQIHNAFMESYLRMDICLSHGQGETSKVRWSGTSAVTVLIQDVKPPNIRNCPSMDQELFTSETHSNQTNRGLKSQEVIGLVHIANAGNCKALLIQGCLPYRLTKDHTGKNMKERRRVLAAGGSFSNSDLDSRVCGLLPVTRGLGNHGDQRLKDCIIIDPYVTTVPIHQHAQFLVLASGGLWEVLSDEEVAYLLVKMLPDQQIPPQGEISESLLSLHQRQHVQSSTDVISESLLSLHQRQHVQSSTDVISESLLSLHQRQHVQSSTDVISDLKLPEQHNQLNTSAANDQILKEQYCQPNMGVAIYDSVKSEPDLVLKTDQMKLQTPTYQQIPLEDQDLDLRYADSREDTNSQNIRSQVQESTKEPNMVSGSPDICSARSTKEDRRKELSRAMAEHLTQAAILAGAKDNITVVVVLLPACGI
ncbi:hypothetical protein BsWGS_24768 [Bradybaena similaris]